MNKDDYKERFLKQPSLLEYISKQATVFEFVKPPGSAPVLYPMYAQSQELWEVEEVQALIELLQESLKVMPLEPNRAVRVFGEDNE